MESIKLIQKLIDLLQEDEDVSGYYLDKLDWAKNRKQDWENDRIRVGVIGVTSSGKSTLINALLGSRILSSAIAPSSGQLVCCSYGETYSARVTFEDNKNIVLEGDDFTTENLMEYSDERKNPKNEKLVRSIEIQSPNFDLEQDILLIDSPGLDAYGLELHEKITLETLVPTIDVCVFVSTMKTNSDSKTKEILNVVARYGCPLIIVQNMLDAVRPSPSGDKSSKQVAKEHYYRVKKIVECAEIANKDDVEIIQISAEYAKKWRLKELGIENVKITEAEYKRSNYLILLKVICSFLERQRPEIDGKRIESIHNVVGELVELYDSEKKGIVTIDTKEDYYSKKITQVKEIKSRSKGVFKAISSDAEKKYMRLIKEIDESDEYSIEKKAKDVDVVLTKMGKGILEAIQLSNAQVEMLAKEMSIPVRDALQSPSLPGGRKITVEKKAVTQRHKVKDPGLKGRAKRFWGFLTGDGDLGYHTQTENSVEIDLIATRKKMKLGLRDSMERYESTVTKWYEKNFELICDRLISELEKGEEAENIRRDAIIRQEKLDRFNKKLVSFEKEITVSNHSQKNVKKTKKEKYVMQRNDIKFDADVLLETMVKLARRSCINQHQEIMKTYISKIDRTESDAVIIGWDKNCIDEFLIQSGIVDPIILNLSESETVNSLNEKSKCFFILVNVTQFGEAEKQIRDLKLENSITENDYIFWVVQDYEELLNGNNSIEGLQRLVHFQKHYLDNILSVIWIVHSNPIYNLAFLKYQQFEDRTFNDESQLLAEMNSKFREYCNDEILNDLGKMIRSRRVC